MFMALPVAGSRGKKLFFFLWADVTPSELPWPYSAMHNFQMFQRSPKVTVLILFLSSAKFISSVREIPSERLGSKMYFPWIKPMHHTYRGFKVQDYTSVLHFLCKKSCHYRLPKGKEIRNSPKKDSAICLSMQISNTMHPLVTRNGTKRDLIIRNCSE